MRISLDIINDWLFTSFTPRGGQLVARLSIPMAVALTLGSAASLRAEPPSTTLTAVVLDATRAPIAGAQVLTLCPSAPRSDKPVAASDAAGRFTIALPVTPCTVTVLAEGFQPASLSIAGNEGASVSRELTLDVAGFSDLVTVSAPASPADTIQTATKTATPLRDVPQSIAVLTAPVMRDQATTSIADAMRYVPGVEIHQGENNRDQVIIRGNNSSADFFVNGVRDDVQYYRDVYNLERIEVLKGPNAMIFGRGGGGGVVNRVTKAATGETRGILALEGGSFDHARGTADVGTAVGTLGAFRLNAMGEHSGSFRQAVGLDRFGVTPTMSLSLGRTRLTFTDEYLHDRRTADRGISSYKGRPLDVDPSTYFGNPDDSFVHAVVNVTSATIDRQAGALAIRNHTLFGYYDRGYQNYVPGAVAADRSALTMTAYNNATTRANVFNQTDLTYRTGTGVLQHTFLVGTEFGRQSTGNFRKTGYFDGNSTSMAVPMTATEMTTRATFRQSATDADNHVQTLVAAAYGQDQVSLGEHLQLIGGVRLDRFDLTYHNNRNGDTLARIDGLVSPRAGVVVKPATAVSLYGSYSVSYLPSSGDQFSSLTTITQQVKPERFANYEAGIKWDAASGLALTASAYRLDRTNTRSTDPNDPTRIVQTGSQRSNGLEVSAAGQVGKGWTLMGGYAWQDAFVLTATTAAAAGARVPQVPRHSASLWSSWQVTPRVRGGLGWTYRTDSYVAVDNTVTLPGYLRGDAALFVSLSRTLGLQVNVENVLNRRYYATADSNTNISPGSPRAFRAALTATF